MRRLQTYHRALCKALSTGSCMQPSVRLQLASEWRAIVNAPGFPPSFAQWTLRIACVVSFPLFDPEVEFVWDLLQVVQHDARATAQHEASLRQRKYQYWLELDARHGHLRQGYAANRLRSLHEVSTWATPDRASDHFPVRTFVVPPGVPFSVGEAKMDDQACPFTAATEGRVRLRDAVTPKQGRLTQHTTACTPAELSYAFAQFWEPLWNRDGSNSSIDDWPEFLATLNSAPLPEVALQCDPFREDLWVAAARRLSPRKATGVCGWAPADVRLLPDSALQQLARIFAAATTAGLPEALLQARVCVLSKTAAPEHTRHSRPIVVFSVLYRLWASVTARQVLAGWAEVFPGSVAGSMPRRSTSDITLQLQHEIESCLLAKTQALGFPIDIVKCFNQLGWKPILQVMRTLGFPASSLQLWEYCLPRIVRRPSFLGSLGRGLSATNGSLEGDPISVAAMAAFRPAGAVFSTYVDNWSWRSTTVATMEATLLRVLEWLQAVKLPIDWSKSYAWATHRIDRKWWQSAACNLLPLNATLQVVSEVRELGAAFGFGPKSAASQRNVRVTDSTESRPCIGLFVSLPYWCSALRGRPFFMGWRATCCPRQCLPDCGGLQPGPLLEVMQLSPHWCRIRSCIACCVSSTS